MKIAICYPPMPSECGVPLLSQNRQFQWFAQPTYIYPVVPAQAATMLKNAGHEVVWLDGIASEWTPEHFEQELVQAKPDLIFAETKTPVVKRHWSWFIRCRQLFPSARLVIAGDHVTALPAETMELAPVDYVLTGGDYDFLLCNLVRHLTQSEPLEPGIWHREGGTIANTGAFKLDHDLDSIPFIDRDLTQWRLYAFKNGNFRKTPGSYMMSGRDCWHGRCTFCSWTTLYPTYRRRSPGRVVEEIGELIERYGIREIMDDTGSLPTGAWLTRFCNLMIERGYNKRVALDCNLRFGAVDAKTYRLMKQAGFRLVLFGVESANQSTLDRLCKALTLQQIEEGAKWASKAGLDVHVTIMFGYPWETEQDMARTIQLARRLLRKGYAYTLQVTLTVPYPGTPLFKELEANGGLLTKDWDHYDMRMNVMRGAVPETSVKAAIRKVYGAYLHPETLLRRLLTTRHPMDDFRFYWRGFRSLIGHLRDFKS